MSSSFVFKLLAIAISVVAIDVSTAHAADSCLSLSDPSKVTIDHDMRARKWSSFQSPDLVPIQFAGKEYWVYRNANFSIIPTRKCNACCGFCSDALKPENSPDWLPLPAKLNQQYMNQLEGILTYLKDFDVSSSVTGGEPTLDVRTPEILRLLKKLDVRKRVMTTNGTLLLKKPRWIQEQDVLAELISANLHHINISRADFDEARNAQIMGFKGASSLTNAELNQVAARLAASQTSLRLSLALTHEGVSDYAGLVQYLEWARSMGVKNVMVRQLYDVDLTGLRENFATSYYKNMGKPPQLDPIFKKIDQDSRFQLVRQISGYYYYVEVYDFAGMRVVLDATDLRILDQERLRRPFYKGKPVIYEMVYHSNGVLSGTWDSDKDVLLDQTQKPF